MLAESAARACSSASSGVVSTYALSLGFNRSMRCRYARVSSSDETSRRRTAAAWSSADANGSMPANGADSHSWIWSTDRGFEVRRVLWRDGHQQPAAGLRVAQHQLLHLRGSAPLDLVAKGRVVAPTARRKKVALRQVVYAIQPRHAPQLDVRAAREVGQVTDEAVTGDVGGRRGFGLEHRPRGVSVERGHHLHGLPLDRRGAQAALDGGRDQPHAERFGQEQDIAG